MSCSTGLPLILVAGLLSQLSCNTAEETPSQEVPPASVTVQTATLRAAPFPQVYEASGTVRARQRAVLASKLQGTILAVHVKLGDTVRSGQVLAEIDHRERDAEVSRMEAAQSALGEALVQATNSLEAAEAEANLASITLRRYQELHEKRSVAQQELDQAAARDQVAQTNVRAARSRIQETKIRQEEAAAALAAVRVRQGYARITAPFAGRITDKYVDEGTLAGPGMPLFTLDESTGYRLEVSIPEAHLAAAKLGARVDVSVPAISLESEGQVIEIEPAAEKASRASLVRISLPVAEELRSGLFGRAVFSLGVTNLLTVPEQAVLREGQLASVFVHQKGHARRRLVTLGRRLDGVLEVLSGLNEGEEVILSGLGDLVDGAPVEILP